MSHNKERRIIIWYDGNQVWKILERITFQIHSDFNSERKNLGRKKKSISSQLEIPNSRVYIINT